jgi:prophage regulatory protein
VQPNNKSPWTSEPLMDRIMREPERRARTGISRVQWWRLEARGEAPRRVSLGSHAIGWLASELQRWIDARAAARGTGGSR